MSAIDDMCTVYRGGLRAGGAMEEQVTPMVDDLRDALERARVVGVLDAWAAPESRKRSWTSEPFRDGYLCTLRLSNGVYESYEANTTDAARAAAAKAIEAGEV